MPKYFGPVSTTMEETVANKFSEQSGLLWTINTNYFNPFLLIIGIDVAVFTKFKNESEILLNDQYIHITQTRNFVPDIAKKIDHLMHQLKVRKTEIADTRLFWKQIGFRIKNSAQYK